MTKFQEELLDAALGMKNAAVIYTDDIAYLLQELDFHQGINISAVLEIKQLKQEIAVRDLALELQNSYSHDLVDGSESNVCEVAGFIRVARKQLSKEDA